MRVWGVKPTHRDLKPENILYAQHENRMLVGDFGIAHFEEEEIYTIVETKDTDRLANFQYSAPEQRVRNSKVDHRADIFALGLILNELFTGEVLQGTGHKKIADVATDYAYLDDLVELMTQQNPANRPESIEKIKMELIGRRNAFIALQKYDESKKQVVIATETPQFEPIHIVSLDYDSDILKLNFSRNVPLDWAKEFQNPRGGYSFIQGYRPERFEIRGNIASINVHHRDENFIQDIVNHAKNYTNAANQGYIQKMHELAEREEKHRRDALQKKIAEAEKRKNILSKVKL
jgi:serine/threonine protein kinase